MTMQRMLFGLLLTAASAALAADPPDLILHHGKVVTVDAKFSIVEAFAVKGDRIVAVGSNDEITQLAGPQTKLVDAQGRTVIPGLIDSHVHTTGASMYEFDHPIPEMDTVADVLKYIAARAELLEDGDWINLSQVFITRLRDQRYPTRQEMDAAAPKNPVVFRVGPDCALNSLAMELSGINKDFQLPAGHSGLIERDPATGEPTGILRNASGVVKSKSKAKSATPEEQRERLRLLFADYNSVGITSVADRSASDGGIAAYQALKDRGELTCRVFLSYGVNGQAPIEEVEKGIQKGADHPLHQYNEWIWLRGIKVFLDGGMLTGSAYMRQPWGVSSIYSITDPEYRGLLFLQPDHLERMARYALERDLQFTAHSVGDGAVHTLIDAYAKINATLPLKERRPCITHCNFMSAEAVAKMAEIGIVADLQPAWLWLDGATLKKQFGDDRLAYFQPYRSLADAGVIVGGGSDHMQKIGSLRSVNPYNPFLGMWITLTRQPRRMEGPLHPEQALTRAEALRLYTINNAYLTFEEHLKGSLEPGKLADFVVLQTDILECPVEAVKDIAVAETYVGGKRVFGVAE
ncbi:MAG: amidohydrolase [Planctomycetaceae bacterium]|nr:amidohydrolase [Planctomycetaceae bacterium]